MDYFRITVIILLTIICYKIFWLDCKTTEGFESTTSNIDDGVSINALGQISRKLLTDNNLTIPSNLTIPGKLTLGTNTTDIATQINALRTDLTALNTNAIKWDSNIRLWSGTGNYYIQGSQPGGNNGADCNSWTSLQIKQALPYNNPHYKASGSC